MSLRPADWLCGLRRGEWRPRPSRLPARSPPARSALLRRRGPASASRRVVPAKRYVRQHIPGRGRLRPPRQAGVRRIALRNCHNGSNPFFRKVLLFSKVAKIFGIAKRRRGFHGIILCKNRCSCIKTYLCRTELYVVYEKRKKSVCPTYPPTARRWPTRFRMP